jgi:hypothetical protein
MLWALKWRDDRFERSEGDALAGLSSVPRFAYLLSLFRAGRARDSEHAFVDGTTNDFSSLLGVIRHHLAAA